MALNRRCAGVCEQAWPHYRLGQLPGARQQCHDHSLTLQKDSDKGQAGAVHLLWRQGDHQCMTFAFLNLQESSKI